MITNGSRSLKNFKANKVLANKMDF